MAQTIHSSYAPESVAAAPKANAPSPTSSSQGSTWDPSALNPVWADIEIAALCICLLLECEFIGETSIFYVNMTTDPVVMATTNRLNRLIDESNASPAFKDFATQCIEDVPDKDNVKTPAALKQDVIDGFKDLKAYAKVADIMDYDKSLLLPPNDDGTALFCLTVLFAADFVYENPDVKQDWAKRGTGSYNGGPWVTYFSYPTPNGSPAAEVYGLQAAYYLQSKWPDTHLFTFFGNKLGIDITDLPSPEENQANAEALWTTTLYGDTEPPPPTIPLNPDETDIPPYDTTAPDEMSDPYNPYGTGNDVYSKTYLWLEWLEMNPTNTDGPEVFLLYLSSLCAAADAGVYNEEQFDDFANILVSIENDEGKTLIAECVDITMEQMCLTGGYTPDTAAAAIESLFPGDDPISVAVCNEAEAQADVMNADGYVQPSQDEIEDEWATYMTDPSTVSSIDEAQAEIMGEMIDDCGDNVYAAMIVILLLLEAAAMVGLDAYGAVSEMLATESDMINELLTEWNTGEAFESAEAAEAWMQELQDLQTMMNETPFDDDTMDQINLQFENIYNQPALDYRGDEIYVDEDGTEWVQVDNGTYCWIDTDGSLHGTPAEDQPDPDTLTPLTIGDQAYGYTDASGQTHDADPDGLLLTFELYQPQDGSTVVSDEYQSILLSLDALTKPITSLSATDQAEMQNLINRITLYENAFESMIADSSSPSSLVGLNSAINDNVLV